METLREISLLALREGRRPNSDLAAAPLRKTAASR